MPPDQRECARSGFDPVANEQCPTRRNGTAWRKPCFRTPVRLRATASGRTPASHDLIDSRHRWRVLRARVRGGQHQGTRIPSGLLTCGVCTLATSWRVYIVSHERVYPAMYEHDPLWSTQHYTFVNVGPGTLVDAENLPVVRQLDLPNARPLGKHWAESEAIYNIYRSGAYRDVDFVGFLQYDKEFRLRKRRLGLRAGSTNITARIQAALTGQSRCHISFETHSTKWDYNQRIMADVNDTETLVGNGRNCYEYILDDYNEFFGRAFTLDDVLRRRRINLCSCFLLDVGGFERMMEFFSWVVESGRLDVFDQQRRHRLQGGLAERYFGIFLLFEYDHFVDIDLHHRNLKAVV